MIGIYCFTNLKNGRKYVGQSIQIEERKEQHRRAAKDPKRNHTELYRAMNKYGFEVFKFEVLEECSKNMLDEREIYWIAKMDSYKNGYNNTEGADYNPSHYPEIVARRTKVLLENEEVNKKLSHPEEDNPNAKLTKEDVIKIRTLYNEGKPFKEVYPLFSHKVSYSGFQYCWRGKSWSNVMPEVFEKRPLQNNGGSTTPRAQIYQMRLEYMNGATNKELQAKYNRSYAYVRRVLKMERWLYEDTIPEGYRDFILK